MRCARLVGAAVLLIAVTAGCGSSNERSTGPPVLRPSPEHVNRVIPGHRPLALVQVAEDDGGEVHLRGTTDLAGATVSLVPESVTPGATAEVWVDLPEVQQDVPFTATVTASRDGDSSVTFSATAVAGTDDLVGAATPVAAVFLRDLAAKAPELPDGVSELTAGTPVAGLLVVSHYAWFTDELEIGLAWHIMLAPDDFSELYIRPRDELVPTRAWRIDSWSMALAGDAYTLTEIQPPAEVTR
jgi:hypothetical protein